METPQVLAAIDLGTNTFNLTFAEIKNKDEVHIKEKYKEMVRLGQGGISKAQISPEAFERGLNAMKKFKKIIEARGTNRVIAFATSAIRSAKNGKDFIKAVKEQTGIDIQVINGNEEAALIYQGIKHAVHLDKEEVLMIDIGGGSVEFIVGNANTAKLIRSVNVGAQRLLDGFVKSDPITENDLKNLKNHLKTELEDLLQEIQEFDIKMIVGSSGSFEALGQIIAHKQKKDITTINEFCFTPQDFKPVFQQIIKSDLHQRLHIPGMDKQRADMIVPGSILVDFVLSYLPTVKTLKVSHYALKEGIIYNYVEEHAAQLSEIYAQFEQNIRTKSVKMLSKKFGVHQHHALHVSHLAANLFNVLLPLHQYSHKEAELLKYGALLHEIGIFINRSGYHKHGQYIILHSGLAGFNSDEIIWLSNLVRYHRKSLPSLEHLHYNILSPDERDKVNRLSAILRLAVGLDYARRHIVNSVSADIKRDKVMLYLYANEIPDVEIDFVCQNATEHFKFAFNLDLKLEYEVKRSSL
ncbi:MAG: Ppx/GppA family phosphatase [Bacteroidia bacterium]|nr:Ppx/GppA family phosphatase [Bacteroidia bacterium]MDW8347758.1 Ppx/GppA phosphatase family protein [Bacteroidia bacterium]